MRIDLFLKSPWRSFNTVLKSKRKKPNQQALDGFLSGVGIIAIFNAIPLYAREKARLRQSGNAVDDFDLLIGATAIVHGLVMVTRNIREFSRLEGIEIEDWTSRQGDLT